MKIMHLADLHLGSQMKKFPKDKAEERRREIRSSAPLHLREARE